MALKSLELLKLLHRPSPFLTFLVSSVFFGVAFIALCLTALDLFGLADLSSRGGVITIESFKLLLETSEIVELSEGGGEEGRFDERFLKGVKFLWDFLCSFEVKVLFVAFIPLLKLRVSPIVDSKFDSLDLTLLKFDVNDVKGGDGGVEDIVELEGLSGTGVDGAIGGVWSAACI